MYSGRENHDPHVDVKLEWHLGSGESDNLTSSSPAANPYIIIITNIIMLFLL